MSKPKKIDPTVRAALERVFKVTITPTAQGDRQYLQIISADGWSTNIVLVADRFDVKDTRP